jgi:SAM-dependent methyltransferase
MHREGYPPDGNSAGRNRKSLATGFRDVDTSGDTDACHRCLDLIAGIPFFQDVKSDSIRIIAEAQPSRVLDAGCGTGVDLLSLVSALPARTQVVGLDASAALLARASERTTGIRDQCPLIRGDLLKVPFRDSSFSACRIDRVLQHIREPVLAVAELTRILVPGGTLVAFDNDWDTLSISLEDRQLAARIGRFWRDSFASGSIGRDLSHIFQESEFCSIHGEPRTLVLTDLPVAERLFDIPHLLDRMIQAGDLKHREATAVRNELKRQADEGTFTSGYTGYLVWGTKEK